ncbi:hypothetical protein HS088_TW13G01547 [Tripterygium wilfordii]|uniref:FLZ-type domain-containing protein n=1 Tax=Tripterygium wilfordii TaxID=458696 RepID=A0A7J7CXP1_TRIWF|nr:FCS-Like Zinc finger 8-like [Tripterygium wilfordii]XP_038721412.1 FCS-Like Zinc finger 8-like [Tripterygium wilfordii]KAF5738646.1 hypothetical protein HS088_TW13G01547 [Tripterygium wilfordii]
MADQGSIPSPTGKNRKPTSFPKLFTALAFKNLCETDAVMSPTSILDTKSFSGLKNHPWRPEQVSTPKTPEPRHKLDPKGVGLAIVEALKDEDPSDPKLSKSESRMVLFGSLLKIQIPPLFPSVSSLTESPKSPTDFGIKTKNSQMGSFSSGLSQSPQKKIQFGSEGSGMNTPVSSRVFTGSLCASEMELSEDYTCVIAHGPVPRTTHIFDDCVVESSYGVVGFPASRKENGFLGDPSSYPFQNFLSSCYACKKNLGLGKDIYMYRGEKAFCSLECRYQEMMLEEGLDKLADDDGYETCS